MKRRSVIAIIFFSLGLAITFTVGKLIGFTHSETLESTNTPKISPESITIIEKEFSNNGGTEVGAEPQTSKQSEVPAEPSSSPGVATSEVQSKPTEVKISAKKDLAPKKEMSSKKSAKKLTKKLFKKAIKKKLAARTIAKRKITSAKSN